MTDTEARPFDFRKPCRLSLHVEQRVLEWQHRGCRLLPKKLLPHLPYTTQWRATSPESLDVTTSEFVEFMVAYQVQLEGFEQPTLLGIPSELAVAFVEGILGSDVEQFVEPRAVTSIEVNMLEVVAATIVEALNEGGTGAGYPRCSLSNHEPRPQILRLYPAEPELLRLQFDVTLPCGTSPVHWFIPQTLTDNIFDESEDGVADPEVSRHLQEVALRVPFEIRVELGAVDLPISELGDLQAGDVVVLNQRVSEPLTCYIQDGLTMQAWPGITGGRQSIRVESAPGDED